MVELDEAVPLGIERAPPARRTPAPRSAMEGPRGLPQRVPADLPVNALPVADIEHPRCVRLYYWGFPTHSTKAERSALRSRQRVTATTRRCCYLNL